MFTCLQGNHFSHSKNLTDDMRNDEWKMSLIFGVFFSIMQSIFFMISDGTNEPSKWVFNFTTILGIINQTKEGWDLRCNDVASPDGEAFTVPPIFNFTLVIKR